MRDAARAERARQIEDAAFSILERQGYEGLSMQAVAKAASASYQTLYRWYGDKTGLLEALIRRNTDQVRMTLDQPADTEPMASLHAIGQQLLAILLGPRAVALNRAAAADPTGPLGRALAREGRDAIAPHIVSTMQNAIMRSQLGGGTPQEMAETWFSLLIGDLQVRRVTGALAEPHADYIVKRANDALDRLVRLFPPPPHAAVA